MKDKYFKKLNKSSSGYTILETMIAISLFLVVVTVGMNSLLSANVLHQKSQDMRSIMDGLNFMMEDMSRNIRTGYNFRCINDGNYSSNLTTAKSCSFGNGFAFENALGSSLSASDQWVYKIESSNISKSVDSGTTWSQLNQSPEVVISPVSGFSVLGAEAPAGDNQQPFVIIKLIGTITYKNISTSFSIQTSVSQRLVDII